MRSFKLCGHKYFVFRNGFDKTGVLLAVATLIERLKVERKIDIFRAVKDLRDYRSGIMDSLVSSVSKRIGQLVER